MDPPSQLGPASERVATLSSATAIVVGSMIGTGLYTSLGFQVVEIRSVLSLLVLWALGGVVAFCGALSYAEMASAFPRSGGEYNFLSRVFHPLAGMLSGWVSVTVGFPAPVALAAIAFGTYLNRVFPALDPLTISLSVVLLTTAIFLFPLRVGQRYLSVFVALNVGLILVLIVSAAAVSEPAGAPLLASDGPGFQASQLGPFAVALVFVMYTYSGWNSSAYVIGDVDDAQRTIPRSLAIGTGVVTLLYIAVNAAFLYTTPMEELAGKLEVGLIASRFIFGPGGGKLMAVAICVGLAASIAAMTWAGPRVAMVMGTDYPMLRALAWRSRFGVPWVAVLWQCSIAVGLLVTSTFEAVLTYAEFILILSSFCTVAGLIVLRMRTPEPHWPYRTWGYPVTPAIFLSVSLYIMVFIVRERPLECLYGVLTLAVGAAVWLVVRRLPSTEESA